MMLWSWLSRLRRFWRGGGYAPFADRFEFAGPAFARHADVPLAPDAGPSGGGVDGTAVGDGDLLRQRPWGAARQRAAVLDAFDPAQPVEDRRQLLGREQELGLLRRAVLEMGAHALIYGARGAGKTSLARAFADHADEQGHIVLYQSAADDCDFSELFRPYLEELAALLPTGNPVSALLTRDRGQSTIGARDICAVMAQAVTCPTILILDEYDRVASPDVRLQVAVLLKFLTDARLPVRLVLVGIARDIGELIVAHPSLRRHLVGVALRPFDVTNAEDLFTRGARLTGIRFPLEARTRITALAGGSPYHLRLFCFSAAMEAIDRGGERVDGPALEAGLEAAYALWASTNAETAQLFDRLADRGEPLRERLRDLTMTLLAADARAAEGGDTPASAERELKLFSELAPALAYSDHVRSHGFADSLAGQFLLVACHLARQRDAPRGAITSIQRQEGVA